MSNCFLDVMIHKETCENVSYRRRRNNYLFVFITLIKTNMNIRIKATNITLTPGITDYVNKSLDKIDKIIGTDGSVQCDVEIARTTNHHQKGDVFMAEVHIVGPGVEAYATSEHEDLNVAISDVRDEVLRKLQSVKGKKLSYMRRSGAMLKAMMKGAMPWGEDGWYGKRK